MLPRPSNAGLAIIELLLGVFVLAILSVAVLNLASVSTNASLDSKTRNLALGLVNKDLETVRGMVYSDVVTTNPKIHFGTVITQNNQKFTLDTVITLLAGQLAGTPAPAGSEAASDIKKVQVKATWNSPSGVAQSYIAATYVSRISPVSTTPPTTATLTGPTTGVVNVASTNFTITLNNAATSSLSFPITSSVGGDTITSTPVVIGIGATTGTFKFTPTTVASRNITLGAGTTGLTIAGSPIAYNATAAAPTTATLTGPTTGVVNVASTNFTITLNAAATSSLSFPITSSVGGDTITSTPVVIGIGATTGTFKFTPTTVGSRNITLGAGTTGLTIAGSPIAYNATAALIDNATCTNVTGPNVVLVNQSFSTNFTFQNTGTTTWTHGVYQMANTYGAPVFITLGTDVAPSGSGTYTLTLTAPVTPGSYSFVTQMVPTASWTGAFGAQCSRSFMAVNTSTTSAGAVSNIPTVSVIDTVHGFAYFAAGVYTTPTQIAKVRLSDFAEVGTLNFPAGEDYINAGVIDPAGGYAYFGTNTSPAKVVKVQLSNFTRVGSITLNSGENLLRAATIDPTGGYAYFGTSTSPGIVVKIQLSNFTRVGALTLNSGEDNLLSGSIDTAAGYAYFGTNDSPAKVVKVQLSNFTRVGALVFNSGENQAMSVAMDIPHGFMYFGTYTAPPIVVKVQLSNFTRVGAITLNTGENYLQSAAIDTAAGFLYFGNDRTQGVIIKVNLSTFTRVGALNVGSVNAYLFSAVTDPTAGYVYFCVAANPGKALKIRLSDFTQVGVITLNTITSDTGWFAESTVYKNGIPALQSGAIPDSSSTSMTTTVTGTGTITYWQQVSSQAGADYLSFFIDGVQQSSSVISGTVAWQQKSYSIAAGTHTLEWRYYKDASGVAGSDAGWVDDVTWTTP